MEGDEEAGKHSWLKLKVKVKLTIMMMASEGVENSFKDRQTNRGTDKATQAIYRSKGFSN